MKINLCKIFQKVSIAFVVEAKICFRIFPPGEVSDVQCDQKLE